MPEHRAPDRLPPERAGLLERQRSGRAAGIACEKPVRARERQAPGYHILALATGWRSAFGGLNTLNRELCCALAAEGCRVVCVVPQAEAVEFAHARSQRVELVVPDALWPEVGRTDLPRGFVPEVLIGHGRITGRAAMALKETYSGALRVHVLHVAPDEIDPFRPWGSIDQGSRSEERTREELELGKSAHRLVAVGPVLHGRYLTDFAPLTKTPVLRLDPGFDTHWPSRAAVPTGTSWRVLLLGRADDATLKGLDVAARAVALASERRGRRRAKVEFWVRGAPPGTADDLRTQLSEWADSDAARIVVRNFSTDPAELQADLSRASLVLMPSRAEGFGLAGLEAIIAGVPVLVSRSSGLGEMLADLVSDETELRMVLPVDKELSLAADRWARAIEAQLGDREAAFARAGRLRSELAARRTWSMAAASLLRSL